MIIFDYSFRNTGGAGISRPKHAVHSIPIFLKKFFSVAQNIFTSTY